MIFCLILIICFSLISLLSKKNIIYMLISLHILITSLAALFVFIGVETKEILDGNIYGLLVLISGIPIIIIGLSLSLRAFMSKGNINLSSFKDLKG